MCSCAFTSSLFWRCDPAILLQVKYEYGKASFEKLKAAGANADFRTYKHLQHGVDPQEVQVG